ncbi:MAG: TonB-dependent receptor [Pseudomonadota bacterium]
MSIWDKERLLRSTILAGFAATAVSVPAIAQDGDAGQAPPVTVDQSSEDDSEATSDDRIVVTGSRIRRDSFTSTSPLQVVDSATISEAGLIDVGEILRSTTVVQGVQLDQQFNSLFVSDAGPGGQAVGLRGLGPERTLNLVNGRRMAPAGVEGAPSFPDISLIPSSAIERVDILLDGASSVYGSDAVGGVINFILRDSFDGIQVEAQYNAPQESGGASSQINMVMGQSNDRGRFIFALEHTDVEELRGNDRDWMCHNADDARAQPNTGWDVFAGETICGPLDIVSDDNGTPDDPSDDFIDRFVGTTGYGADFIPAFGTFLVTRVGTPNPAFGVLENYEIWDFSGQGLSQLWVKQNEDQWLTPQSERLNAYFSGEYDLDAILPGTSAFFEFGVANRQTYFEFDRGTLGTVAAWDSPYVPQAFNGFTTPAVPGLDGFDVRPLTPWTDYLNVELTQWRSFGGLQGDLSFAGLPSWDYEAFAGYTRSQGFAERTVVREEALIRSMNVQVNPDTGVVECAPVDELIAPFNSGISDEPCIPFNMLFPGLFPLNGEEPVAEDPRIVDYLRGFRTSTTFVDERIAGGFVTGPVYNLPAGDLQVVLGAEWRESAIDTRSDDTTIRGLGDGFFTDRRTAGSVELFEVYGEASIPILEGHRFAEVLEVSLAGRYVDHEFYGSNEVYSGNIRYQPFDWLTVRGTYGTSFRAPNLRELFLEGQSSFAAVTDPCEVPVTAQDDTDGEPGFDTYNGGEDLDGDGVGDRDGRSLDVINNCITEGLDPFSLALGVNTGSVEVFNAGNTGLDPEESTAWTAGFVVDQPWFDWIDLRVGVNFFEYKIENSVFSPTAQFLVTQCYTSEDFPDDPFCTRRSRDPLTGFLLEVDATPFNIAEELSAGYDLNLAVAKDFDAFGRNFRVSSDVVATMTDEVSQTIIFEGADPDFDDDAGQIGNPYWRANFNQRLESGPWTLFWQARYIGDQGRFEPDPSGGLLGVPGNCDGGTAFVPECYKVDAIFYHNVSLTYQQDTWTVRAGINNLLDQDPPVLDEDIGATLDARGVPIGVGYDRIGRQFFLNLSKAF